MTPSSTMVEMEGEKDAAKPAADLELLVALRGPALILLVGSWIAFLVLQSVSYMVLLQLSLFSLGCLLCAVDLQRVGQRQCRLLLQRWLDGMVWDDILMRFFNPTYTWAAMFTENIVGQAMWVYSLPSTTPSQRLTLTRAALGVDEPTAHRILFERGGFKSELFPRSFVEWLENDDEGDNNHKTPQLLAVSETSSSGSSEDGKSRETQQSSSSEEKEGFEIVPKPSQSTEATTTPNDAIVTSNNNPPPSSGDYAMLSKTVQTILKNALVDQLNQLLQMCHDGTTESQQKMAATVGVGALASLALQLQLRYSSRARKIALFLLELSTMAGLSSIVMAALTLLAATAIPKNQNGNLQNMVQQVSGLWKSRVNNGGLLLDSSDKNQTVRRIQVGVSASVGILAVAAWKNHRKLQASRRRPGR